MKTIILKSNRENAGLLIEQAFRQHCVIGIVLTCICGMPLIAISGTALYMICNSIPIGSDIVMKLAVSFTMLFLYFFIACFANLASWRQWRIYTKATIRSSEPVSGFLCEFRQAGGTVFADIGNASNPDTIIWSEELLDSAYENIQFGQKFETSIFFAVSRKGSHRSSLVALDVAGNIILLNKKRAKFIEVLERSQEILDGVKNS
ncbi:MAG: hypothetical protein SGJ27_29985 [Candidatus Melainabacteria bacterium]|nr:hypothetical protein [Candidatus Melainabacteria bacterium]